MSDTTATPATPDASAPSLSATGLTYFDATRRLGVRSLQLQLAVNGTPRVVSLDTIAGLHGRGHTPEGLILAIDVEVVNGNGDAILVRQSLHNPTERDLHVSAMRFGMVAPDSGVFAGKVRSWDFRFCHTDNVRTEKFPYCEVGPGYVQPLPARRTLLGAGEDQPFPAVYLCDRRYAHGLIIGAATQNRFYTTWEVQKNHHAASLLDSFQANFDPRQITGLTIPPGGELPLETLWIERVSGRHVQAAWDGLVAQIGATHDLLGKRTPLLDTGMHCTWNYGVFSRQIGEELLVTARFISQNFPGIKYFLMDAGYVWMDKDKSPALNNTFADRFYPTPDVAVCKTKFPNGMKAYTDEVRSLGLKPGIWWSPTVRLDSQLVAEHPEWVLRDHTGDFYRIGNQGFLDLTLPAARAYIDRTLAVVLGEWGFDALKMDFWSQMVEDRNGRTGRDGVTSLEVRRQLFEIIRKHLPPDGTFMTCVATGMGNPFIGQWADTYRNTIDIGVGDWDEQIANCIWALPTLLQSGRDTFLLNNDSIGVNQQAPDNENYFRFTWMHMNMGLMETGGRMEQWSPEWVRNMRKVTDRIDRGHRVRCPDERAFGGEPLPESLVVDYPADSKTGRLGVRQNLAFFNWSDEPRQISVLRTKLGHTTAPVLVEDFWTGDRVIEAGEFITRRLAPRSAWLVDVMA